MLEFNPYSVREAIKLGVALLDLYNGVANNPTAAALWGDPAGGVQFVVNPHADDRVSSMSMRVGNDGVVLCGGCPTAVLGLAIDNAYVTAPNEFPGNGENVTLANVTLRCVPGLSRLSLAGCTRLLVAGYSAGGVVASYFAATLRTLLPACNVSCVAFNPPRMAVIEWRRRVETFPLFRFHCEEDPIQQMPLHSDESDFARRFSSEEMIRNANRYWHHGRGYSLAPDGVGTPLEVGDIGSRQGSGYLSIVGWATGLDSDAVEAHSLAELVRRLRANALINALNNADYALGNAVASTSSLQPGGVESYTPPVLPVPPGNNGFIGPHAMENIAAALDPGRNIVPVKPAEGAPLRYYARKVAGKWYVLYRGNVIYGPYARNIARRDASRLNSITRRASEAETIGASEFGRSVESETGGAAF